MLVCDDHSVPHWKVINNYIGSTRKPSAASCCSHSLHRGPPSIRQYVVYCSNCFFARVLTCWTLREGRYVLWFTSGWSAYAVLWVVWVLRTAYKAVRTVADVSTASLPWLVELQWFLANLDSNGGKVSCFVKLWQSCTTIRDLIRRIFILRSWCRRPFNGWFCMLVTNCNFSFNLDLPLSLFHCFRISLHWCFVISNSADYLMSIYNCWGRPIPAWCIYSLSYLLEFWRTWARMIASIMRHVCSCSTLNA